MVIFLILILLVLIISFWKFKDQKLIQKAIVYDYIQKPSLTKLATSQSLKNIVNVLNNSQLRWGVTFGTLLGLIRDKNPIEGDDDIDIVISVQDKSELLKILKKNDYRVLMNHEYFVQVEHNEHVIADYYLYKNDIKFTTKDYAVVDFYLYKEYVNETYDICIPWEQFPIKFYPIKKIEWNGLFVNIPQDSIKVLEDFYESWKTPEKGKGHRKKRPKCS